MYYLLFHTSVLELKTVRSALTDSPEHRWVTKTVSETAWEAPKAAAHEINNK